ncbi:MAG: glycine zipper family protein [Steroidobacteraceae bacterium]
MRHLKWIGISCLAGSLLGLAACATSSARPVPRREVPPPEPPPQQLYFYPTAGQTPAQQDRDRYECYGWAVKQTGFDPGRERVSQEHRVTVEPAAASGTTTIAGVATGAILGAVVSRPGNAGGGAVIGAVAGGLLGAAAENAQEAEAARMEDRANARLRNRGRGRNQQQAVEYRRAMSACLEGRGYTVK